MSLIALSFRRDPAAPTNAQRLAAYRALVPPPSANAYPWLHLQPRPTPRTNIVPINRRRKA